MHLQTATGQCAGIPFLLDLSLFTISPPPQVKSVPLGPGPGTREECVGDFSGWHETIKKGYFSGVSIVIFMLPLIVMVSGNTVRLTTNVVAAENSQKVNVLKNWGD